MFFAKRSCARRRLFLELISRFVARQLPHRKLYLNLKILQVRAQLLWRLIVNDRKSETARAFKVEGAIVDENALFGGALGDSESDAIDAFFWFARMDVARAEENLKISAKIESFDAVLV